MRGEFCSIDSFDDPVSPGHVRFRQGKAPGLAVQELNFRLNIHEPVHIRPAQTGVQMNRPPQKR
jgi:hypothetical protein